MDYLRGAESPLFREVFDEFFPIRLLHEGTARKNAQFLFNIYYSEFRLQKQVDQKRETEGNLLHSFSGDCSAVEKFCAGIT